MRIPARPMTLGPVLSSTLATTAIVATTLFAVPATTVEAAAPVARQDAETPAQMLEEFIHYTSVAKPDLAIAWGEMLLDSGATNATLAEIVDAPGFDRDRLDAALERAMRVDELESLAGELMTRIEGGRLELAREGDRIDGAVQMLVGTIREQRIARERLIAAGEYAVPALLRTITEGADERLKMEARKLLADKKMGRMAVTPLCIALPNVDADSQVTICRLLAEIGYAHAAPYLAEIATDPSMPSPVTEAAAAAFEKVQGGDADVAGLYAALGQEYFSDLSSLVAYPFDPTNNVWAYDAFVGLIPTPVDTAIFNEVMAMQVSSRALDVDPTNRAALALFIASNLKRENELPSGVLDPIYGDSDRSPAFYATVFGTSTCQDVLALALDATDTPLVRDAIAALSHTTGGSNLFSRPDRRPLLEALDYPDRRVQYEAALTLGAALPESRFSGDQRVVPILASAARSANEAYAIIVADNDENRQVERERMQRMGFTIVAAEPSLEAARTAMNDVPGIDLVVVRLDSAEAASQTIASLQSMRETSAAPVLAVVSAVDATPMTAEYRGNPRLRVTRSVGDEAMVLVVEELLDRAAGGRLTDTEADEYAFNSLGVLRDIAISKSPAYTMADAEPTLLSALERRDGGVRLLVAEILSYIDSDAAQQAIFDAALAASGGEQISLLDAATHSVKRFGDRADRRHVMALIDLVGNSTGGTAEAAARLHGALNRSTTESIGLITGGG